MAVLNLTTTFDDKGAVTGIRTVTGETDKLEKSQQRLKTSTGSLTGSLKTLAVQMGLAYAGYKALRALTIDAVAAQDKQVDSINKLNLALANQGHLLPGVSKSLQDQAKALQATSRYGDEAIIQNQALLASYGMNEEQIKRTTKISLDFAAATGTDLKTAFDLLGKASTGYTGTLSRYGIIVDQSLSSSGKFEAALEQLEKRFSGGAQADVATLSGSMAQLKNTLGDTQESVGKLWEEIVSGPGAIDALKGSLVWLQTFFGHDLVIALADSRAAFAETMASFLENWAKAKSGMSGSQKTAVDLSLGLASAAVLGPFGGGMLAGLLSKTTDEGAAAKQAGADLRQMAAEIRAAGQASANSAGHTRTFANVLGGGGPGGGGGVAGAAHVAALKINDLGRSIAGVGWQRLNALNLGPVATLPTPQNLGQLVVPGLTEVSSVGKEVNLQLGKATAETVNWHQKLADVAHLMQAMGGAGGFLGSILGGVAGIGAALDDLHKAMDPAKGGLFGGGFKNAMGGLTAILGGVGAAVGIGKAVVGLFKSDPIQKAAEHAGTELGVTVSRQLAETIHKQGQQLGINDAMASLLHIADAAKDAGVPISDMYSKIGDLMNAVALGSVPATEGIQALGQDFDALRQEAEAAGETGSKAMRDMIVRAQQLGEVIPEITNYLRDQRQVMGAGAAAGVKGIQIVSVEDAKSQAQIVGLAFWETFAKDGLIAASDAFKDSIATIREQLTKLGGDTSVVDAILGPMEQLAQLGQNEAFRGAAEGAKGFGDELGAITNSALPLTIDQLGAFEQQAATAFSQAKQAAIDQGLSMEDAQKAAFQAIAPLLQQLQSASSAYGIQLDANTQSLLDQAQASGVAFKTDSTDRLVASIDALTTTLGGVPPKFDAIASSGEAAAGATTKTWHATGHAIETTTGQAANLAGQHFETLANQAIGQGEYVSIAWAGGMGELPGHIEAMVPAASEGFQTLADAMIPIANQVGNSVWHIAQGIGAITEGAAGNPFADWKVPPGAGPPEPHASGLYGAGYSPVLLNQDKLILAHAGEHVLILPAGMPLGYMTAAAGFGKRGGTRERQRGDLGGAVMTPTPSPLPVTAPVVVGGGGASSYETTQATAQIQALTAAVASLQQVVATKPEISVPIQAIQQIQESPLGSAQSKRELREHTVKTMATELKHLQPDVVAGFKIVLKSLGVSVRE